MENLSAHLSWACSDEETEERVELIIHKLKFVSERPSVLFLRSLAPLASPHQAAIADMIEVAGGSMLHLSAAMNRPEDVAALAPEILIIAPDNSNIESTVSRLGPLFAWDGWQDLPAVKNNRVYVIDTSEPLNEDRAEGIATLEMLCEIIQPKYFIFGFESSRWVKFGV